MNGEADVGELTRSPDLRCWSRAKGKLEMKSKIQLRTGMAVFYFICAGAVLSGCATGGTGGGGESGHDECLAAANTEEERSKCTFEQQKREQGGRGFGSEAE